MVINRILRSSLKLLDHATRMVQSMFTPAFAELVAAVVDLRKRAGLTQRELARAVGREQNYIARIETGQRRVDLVELVQICRACRANPDEEVGRLVRRLTKLLPAHAARRR